MGSMISVIIPTYNDEGFIKSTIDSLKENAYTRLLKEIVVVDMGSTDQSIHEARLAGATVLRSIRKHRSAALNLGADCATGNILYFVTPGTIAPKNYCNEIVRSIQRGSYLGTFHSDYPSTNWILKSLSKFASIKKWYSRLESHTLFVDRTLFTKAGKFNEALTVMEDHDLINRLQRYSKFDVINEPVKGSLRRFENNTIFRSEASYLLAYWMFDLGYSNNSVARWYHALLGSSAVCQEDETELSASFN